MAVAVPTVAVTMPTMAVTMPTVAVAVPIRRGLRFLRLLLGFVTAATT